MCIVIKGLQGIVCRYLCFNSAYLENENVISNFVVDWGNGKEKAK